MLWVKSLLPSTSFQNLDCPCYRILILFLSLKKKKRIPILFSRSDDIPNFNILEVTCSSNKNQNAYWHERIVHKFYSYYTCCARWEQNVRKCINRLFNSNKLKSPALQTTSIQWEMRVTLCKWTYSQRWKK